MKNGEIACVVGRVIKRTLLLRINRRISARHALVERRGQVKTRSLKNEGCGIRLFLLVAYAGGFNPTTIVATLGISVSLTTVAVGSVLRIVHSAFSAGVESLTAHCC